MHAVVNSHNYRHSGCVHRSVVDAAIQKARLSVNHMQLCGNNSEKQGNFYFLSSGLTDVV